MRSLFRATLGLGLGLAPLLLTQLVSAPTATAQGPTPPAALIVLDASGSMAAPGPGGGRLIDQAKAAVNTTVSALPAGSQVGLRVYGSEVSSDESQRAAGCQDSKLVVPVGALDPAAVNAAMQTVQPKGWTPIGLALQQGAKDLPATGPRTIVLVSDGLDTCAPPDPCEVAKQLNTSGVPVKVEAIGFNLPSGDPARGQLQCIAGATGGEYRDAADAGQLTAALQTSSQRALRGFNAAGTATTGTPSPVGAPYLPTDKSASRDTIAPGQTKYYALPVKAGDRPETSATLGNDQPGTVADKSCGAQLKTYLVSPGAFQVDTETKSFDGRKSVTLRNSLSKDYSVVAPLTSDGTTPRLWGGIWYLQVELTPSTCSSGDVPLPQRDFQLELSASGATLTPPPTVATVVGGTASTNAATLTSGTPVRDTIRVGETAWYSIDVPKGSRVGAQLVTGGDPSAVDNACTATAKVEITNRDGESVNSGTTSFDGRKAAGARTTSSSSNAVGETANEYSSIAKEGKYFVTASLRPGSSCTGKIPVSDLEYPIQLTAQVVPFNQTTTTTAAPPPSSVSNAASADEGSGSGLSPWLWVGLGVLLLGAAAIILLVVLTQRRRGPSGPPTGMPPPY